MLFQLPFTLPLIPKIIICSMTLLTILVAFIPSWAKNKWVRRFAGTTLVLITFWFFHYYLALTTFDTII